jgi:CO/xanthine dehydrogenase FAD-binding subunit
LRRNKLSYLKMDISDMRYEKPVDAAMAVELLQGSAGVVRVLSGGTDLLVQLKAGMVEPDLIVDIKGIAGISDIVPEAGGFRIGAAVSGAELGEHDGLVALWPGVVEGAELIGSTQVQGRASMVGNLCNGSPAADSVPALVAAGAVARIAGPDGTRDCPVVDIPVSPGKISLGKGELIISVFVPARPKRASDAYLRFIPRTEMDIAVAAAGVSLELDVDGVCVVAHVALGAVAPTVLMVEEAAAAIIGTKLDDAALEALAAACSKACNPIDDKRGTIAFRTQTAGVLAKRAALIAYERAGENA